MSTKNLITLLTALILSSCCNGNKVTKTTSTKPVATSPIIVQTPGEKTTVVRTIFFDVGASALSSEALETLDGNVVTWMKENPKVNVVVEGHCDERGSAAFNLVLGQKRADSVKQYLVQNGIESSRISTVSYGLSRPLDLRHNEEAWSKNRRVATIAVAK